MNFFRRNYLTIIVPGLVVFAGSYFLLATRAASPAIAVEAESGVITAPAAKTVDTAASGGTAVKFSAAQPPVQPGNGSIKRLAPGTSWQWQLTGTVDTTVLDTATGSAKMYDVDLFDTPLATIQTLKAKKIVVICYFSAGSSENWRPDFNKFPASVQGKPLSGWAGEKWLDVRQVDTLGSIMGARMDLAMQKGCDGVEPDNVDGYTNPTGFPLTAANQLAYNKSLAQLAHARNLSVGLKNDVDQIGDLVGSFDWALNEQCNQYNECNGYAAFIAQGKAVFGVEYQGSTATFCSKMNQANYDWLLKDLNLSAKRTACRNG